MACSAPRTPLRLRLRDGTDSLTDSTRLRPGGGRIETASRRHHPPPCIDDTLILNCLSLAQTLPKPSQNLPQTLPKWSQNRSRRPLGAYLGSMLKKRWFPNAQKAAQKPPRAPKRRPRPSQTPPKWNPRPSQVWFACDFSPFICQLQICIDFLLDFHRFVVL